MRNKILSSALTLSTVAAAAVATVVVGTGGAGASNFEFVGYAGGSQVRALNNTITSDLTAASAIGAQFPVSSTNDAAAVNVQDLLTTHAVATSSKAEAIDGGWKVTSEAKLADLNLLNGAITADAIDTTSTAKLVNGVISSGSTTKFVNLKIVGINLPINIPNNFHVTIPGIASVYINYTFSAGLAPSVMNIGMGLYLSLLKPQGANGVGASVEVDPVYSAIGPVTPPPTNHIVRGKAYGTSVTAKVGSLAQVQSDPTAPIQLRALGSDGKVQSSSIAGVNLTSLAHVGAVTDTVSGTNTNQLFESESTSKVAGINLFNGLIKADAISVDAHARGTDTTPIKVTGSSSLVNLVIAGNKIPISAAPNTVIKLLNIGKVIINKQVAGPTGIQVRGLEITLSTAAYGLPAGADVQVAAANASVG